VSESIIETNQPTNTSPALGRILQFWLVLAIPILLVIANVRLLMTPAFLQFEYSRPGFPEDSYGFTQEDRLEYAPLALEYLMNNQGIEFLEVLRLPGEKCYPPMPAETDCPMYSALELRHMYDVKVVTSTMQLIGLWGGILTMGVLVYLFLDESRHLYIQRGLFQGSILTLVCVGAIIIGAIAAWGVFFDLFHEILFEEGTWRFYFSDTLIRLFPEQFWFDAALIIGGLTTLLAAALLILSWRWGFQLTAPGSSSN